MMTHHSVMTSSLRIKISKFGKFSYFSCEIHYNTKTDVFRDAISLIINQCDPRRPKGASGGHQPRSTSKRIALVYMNINRVLIVKIISRNTAHYRNDNSLSHSLSPHSDSS